MGTSLTGTKPKDTYDSLIKVGDNGPISGTAKYLSDGLGNDLPIAVSTSNVGIGTSSLPADTNLAVLGNFQTGFYRNVTSGDRGYVFNLGAKESSGALTNAVSVIGVLESTNASGYMLLQTRSANTLSTRVRIDADGLKFGTDSAAANALDDYEEGTWTPTFTDTLGNDVTASSVGRYTKIGRQVTLSLTTTWSNKSAASAGSLVYMSGVPFNMNNKANGIITYYDDMNLTTVGAFTIANAGTTLCYFPIQDNAVEASFLTFGETTNTSTFWFTLTYFV